MQSPKQTDPSSSSYPSPPLLRMTKGSNIGARFLRKLKFIPNITSSLKQPFYPLHQEHVKDHKDDDQEQGQMQLEFTSVKSNKIVPSADHSSPILLDFEEKCPPGGTQSVILYTTSFRGIRKTFEDCSQVRFLLESFKVLFHERDVSMHMEFRDELWGVLNGGGRVIPPKLFINGRFIGGADEVLSLHEQGRLKKLLEGSPLNMSDSPCKGCNNLRFVVCFECSGSRKVFRDRAAAAAADDDDDDDSGGDDTLCVRCSECNENGLIRCPICSC